MNKLNITGTAPNRRTVEALFRSLYEKYSKWSNDEIDKMRKELDDLEEQLLKNTQFLRLKAKVNKLEYEYRHNRNKKRESISKVQRVYQAKGLTPSVLKLVENLVDTVNQEK